MTLALEIRFLTGRYAATHYNDRRRAEWPPHPARVYSALVAALYADPEHTKDEREALRWLADAGEPEVIASAAEHRRQSDVYVPTNDARVLTDIDKHILTYEEANAAVGSNADEKARQKLEKATANLVKHSIESAEAGRGGTPNGAKKVLPSGRSRQPRRFPVALPYDPVVHLCWPIDAHDRVAEAIDSVAARITRLGHSSSLVSVRVVLAEEVEVGDRRRWTPDSNGPQMLRVPLPGQLERLEAAHERHQQVEPRLLPAGFAPYSAGESRAHVALPMTNLSSSDWIVFEVTAPSSEEHRRLLDGSLAQAVARALRGTLMKAADGNWPEVLSGHEPDGKPSQQAHLAFVPLADVGHRFATGAILGIALIPPADLDGNARQTLLRTVATAERSAMPAENSDAVSALGLVLGRHGVMHVRRLHDVASARTLQVERWTRPARRWASASAVALGRNPGNLRSREPEVVERAAANAEATIASACVNIGLPHPTAVWVHRRSLLHGAPAARRFMPFPTEGGGHRRVCVHAEILFDEPVRGPVILGAGRYFGLGLCSPLEER